MKNRNLTHTLRISYTILLLITLIPSVYSIIVSQIHSFRYTQIIQNVSYANRINNIAKNEIPNELWEIVCGKKDFNSGLQYQMMEEISNGLDEMLKSTISSESRVKLEVANRAGITLLRNINMLSEQMKNGSSVTQNEASLDEIRTITALFSDIMQDFIVAEIESGNKTNDSFRRSSIILTIIQIVITIFAIIISMQSFFGVSNAISKPISDMESLSTR